MVKVQVVLATEVVVSDLLNVALFFESNLHTLPPHFELKTEETKRNDGWCRTSGYSREI